MRLIVFGIDCSYGVSGIEGGIRTLRIASAMAADVPGHPRIGDSVKLAGDRAISATGQFT
jgi:hypothetical protein